MGKTQRSLAKNTSSFGEIPGETLFKLNIHQTAHIP
jgi:hypothetical protein